MLGALIYLSCVYVLLPGSGLGTRLARLEEYGGRPQIWGPMRTRWGGQQWMGAGQPAQGRQVGAGVCPVPKYIISYTAFLPPGNEKHTQNSGLRERGELGL